MPPTEAAVWLRLSLLPEWNAAKLKRLYETGNANTDEPLTDLAASRSREVENLIDACLQWESMDGNHLVSIACDSYPRLLREIADPPPVLFVKGSLRSLSLPQLGIVGSRKPTPAGRKLARGFAADLCRAGYQVTSGLALGIDGESHQGALDAGGGTIAVLGSGLERIYPRQHSRLADSILANAGALVAEVPPSFMPQPFSFPQRNRIISGLSHGVLVVEAARRSGSLITARLAAEQGREVFSIPGSVRSPLSHGCHFLIRKGAKLVETVADIMEELPAMVAWEREGLEKGSQSAELATESCQQLSDEARRVLLLLTHDPAMLDEIAGESGMDIATTFSILTRLELAGLAVQHEGGFVLNS